LVNRGFTVIDYRFKGRGCYILVNFKAESIL
jgi:hypothetical protein